jgi:hypothetical protein
MATLYLLHFDKPLPQPHNKRGVCARHYLGIADDLDARLAEHAHGNGSKLCAALKARGGGFALVRTWENVTRAHELELKRQRNNPRLCPQCSKRANQKAVLHGNNEKFAGWGKRNEYAAAHPKGAGVPNAVSDDDLPF